eukprot:494972_1
MNSLNAPLILNGSNDLQPSEFSIYIGNTNTNVVLNQVSIPQSYSTQITNTSSDSRRIELGVNISITETNKVDYTYINGDANILLRHISDVKNKNDYIETRFMSTLGQSNDGCINACSSTIHSCLVGGNSEINTELLNTLVSILDSHSGSMYNYISMNGISGAQITHNEYITFAEPSITFSSTIQPERFFISNVMHLLYSLNESLIWNTKG